MCVMIKKGLLPPIIKKSVFSQMVFIVSFNRLVYILHPIIIKLWKIQITDKRWLKSANKQPINNNPMSKKKIIC